MPVQCLSLGLRASYRPTAVKYRNLHIWPSTQHLLVWALEHTLERHTRTHIHLTHPTALYAHVLE